MTLEQYLLATPPPRQLRGTLLSDSPTGAILRRLAVFQLFCLGLAPLPYVLSPATVKVLADFVLFLDLPGLWLALWLLACLAAMVFARYLRRRFSLAETGVAVRGRLLALNTETYTQYMYYTAVPMERFIFTVEFPDGQRLDFRSSGHSPNTMRPTVGIGDAVTALYQKGRFAATCRLLGLENLDSRCELLRRAAYSTRLILLGLAALLAGIAFFLYTVEFFVVIDRVWPDVAWPCLAGALGGIAVFGWLHRRYATLRMKTWHVVLCGTLLGPLAVVGTLYFVNGWLDFGPPEWRAARVESRGVKSVTPQVPIRLGYLQLLMDGQRFAYPCRPSRLDTFGQTVEVRVHRGALGYRWIGSVRAPGSGP